MKKILLFISGILSVGSIYGQVIDSQNFNSLTAGNVGTNFTGASTGQGGYYLLNGAASDYQIATIDAAHANSLKVTAGPGYAATSDPNNHYAIKLVGVNATTGNDIIKATCSFYTGSANGTGSVYITLFDDGTTPSVIISLIYNVATKSITAGGTLSNAGTRGFFGIKTLGAIYPANTWVTVGMAYNMTTGVMNWYTPQESYTFSSPPAGYTLIPGLDVGQYRTYNINASGNSVAYNWAIDDFNLSYSNNTILATKEDVSNTKEIIDIYPNPAKDIVTIEGKNKILSVYVYDLSGKRIDLPLSGNKVNVSGLANGNYLLGIKTEEGFVTKKLIKE
ncbi:T9SS type A sorting domain-containing protein [Chryseobacterium sp. PS-8]|uniref:T9SS type A sorting domain-containing protein n=1 Tax=Chryseobacterium indicum TaxID=2766954 RepID=A0ABS9C3X0_9FLAO|nr:T9SS type A sorting domain-containing protein [Chryseobacterium sp. PS-8]MCF2218948.1 T9SS type A sorting domain-containing protein [Chryseobacterium sp. PS-8]